MCINHCKVESYEYAADNTCSSAIVFVLASLMSLAAFSQGV